VRIRLLIWVLGFAVASSAHAQQATPLSSNLSDAPARMQSADLHIQEAAFDDLMAGMTSEVHSQPLSRPADILNAFFARHPDQADRVKVGLIHMLTTENASFTNTAPTSEAYTEQDMNYYARVIEAVASLNDERAIPPLVGAMTTGGMATRGLLKYGDKALGPVLDELKNPDALMRASALETGISILWTRTDVNSQDRIRQLIQTSLRDPATAVRSQAIMEIDCLTDRKDFEPTLQEIAKTDPTKFPGRAIDGGDGDEFYPVRYAARRALRDTQDNKTCKP